MIIFNRLILWSRRSPIAAPAIIIGALLVSIIGHTIGFAFFEAVSWQDALWASIVSITTIGYGDFYAETPGGRWVTFIFVVVFGLAAFSMVLGWAIDTYTTIAERGKRGMGQIIAEDHVIIVNVPNEARIRQLLRELSVDAQYKDREIVIVSDQISELPNLDGVHAQFVHGSPLDRRTFDRALLEKAATAVVLALDYQRPAESDAYVAAIVLAIEHANPDVHTVAECLDPIHAGLFKASNCNSVVYGLQMATNLLVQELQDPGVSDVFRVLTSNAEGYTLYSTTIKKAAGLSFNKLAHALLDADVNMISVTRDGDHHALFKDLASKDGDVVVYTAKRRYDWKELVTMAGGAPV